MRIVVNERSQLQRFFPLKLIVFLSIIYINQMRRINAIGAILILWLIVNCTATTYQLSPAIPPIAFRGQYYTSTFIVPGVATPAIRFAQLPSFLVSNKAGVIQGNPNVVGSFPIVAYFQAGNSVWQQQIILRVIEPSLVGTPQIRISQDYRNFAGRTIYKVGEDVSIDCSGVISSPQVTWSYMHLPNDLIGYNNGIIKGKFFNDGTYSFGAIASDKSGYVGDYFFTVNVQPTIFSQRAIREVPYRNPLRWGFLDLIRIQQEALANLASAFKIYHQLRAQIADLQVQVLAALGDINLSEVQTNNVQKLVAVVIAKRVKLTELLAAAKILHDNAKNKYNLRLIANQQAIKELKSANDQLKKIQDILNDLANKLEKANNDFIAAQAAVNSASLRLKSAANMIASAQDDITITFNAIVKAKKALQDAQGELKKTDLQASNAMNAKNQAELENDHATSALHKADAQVKKALIDLQNANVDVSHLRGRQNDASKHLGAAKFNYQQAMNRLFVAQAAKEQSDKSMLILSAQSAKLDLLEGQSTYIFSTCQIGAYPTISGSARIKTASGSGYQLDSGYSVIYGACSQTVACSEGDLITFDGFLKDGFIHAVAIAKQ